MKCKKFCSLDWCLSILPYNICYYKYSKVYWRDLISIFSCKHHTEKGGNSLTLKLKPKLQGKNQGLDHSLSFSIFLYITNPLPQRLQKQTLPYNSNNTFFFCLSLVHFRYYNSTNTNYYRGHVSVWVRRLKQSI